MIVCNDARYFVSARERWWYMAISRCRDENSTGVSLKRLGDVSCIVGTTVVYATGVPCCCYCFFFLCRCCCLLDCCLVDVHHYGLLLNGMDSLYLEHNYRDTVLALWFQFHKRLLVENLYFLYKILFYTFFLHLFYSFLKLRPYNSAVDYFPLL